MDYKELDVWNAGLDFVVHVYQVTGKFPKEEAYGLTSQIRRAAVSIPSNIAEGAARKSDKEFVQFLHISLGSLAEAETQLIIAERLKFLQQQDTLFHEIRMLRIMLIGLLRYVRKGSGKGSDGGSDKGNGKGSDGDSDKGSDKGNDNGSDGGNDKGSDKGSDGGRG